MNSDYSVKKSDAYPRVEFTLVTCLFFLSGSAGLVYQVLWMRSLGLFFGSDMHGVAIILGTFMGGLALGSLLGGRFAEKVRSPLMWYGILEVGIGAFALCIPSILESFDPLLRAAYSGTFEETSSGYQLTRMLLASGTLLFPTTLMGATLPLIMRHFVRKQSVLGQTAAFFYGVNTLGALVGTLLAGFLLLPYLGMFKATVCAAAVNFLIGVSSILVGLIAVPPGVVKKTVEVVKHKLDSLPGFVEEKRARIARAAFIGIAVSGAGSLALEVVWTRILIMSFSATVYAFAAMLACFLFGIFLGSFLVAKFVDQVKEPLSLLARLELGVGVTVALLCTLVNMVPGFFASVLSHSMNLFPGIEGGALVLATLVASFFLLVVPTTLLGATFSVALRAYTVNISRIGSRTGNLYFSNTAGAIIGSLGAVFFLLPVTGAKGGLAFIACLFIVNGIYLWVVQHGFSLRSFVRTSVSVPTGLAVIAITAGMSTPYQLTLNFNQYPGDNTRLIYHKEGIHNTIDILRSQSGITSLVIGGNIEADNGYTQRRHFVLKGHLPLMFLEEPESVLVVGLGMGITLQATIRHSDDLQVDVVELSPEILDAHSLLREINNDVARNPRVSIRVDDGRSYMKLGKVRYDMITADPIHPKVSRVGYLYTKEYYEAIRSRLKPGGIVCQWMPIYQMSPTRLRSAMKTFFEVFPNATFWYVKNHGLFVAKLDSPMIDYQLLKKKYSLPAVQADLASIDIRSPEEVLSLLLMGPVEIQAYLDDEPGVPVNTDDYPYLEYFVPRDLFYQPADNVREIVKHLADPADYVINQPRDSVDRLQRLIVNRKERLVTELAENPS